MRRSEPMTEHEDKMLQASDQGTKGSFNDPYSCVICGQAFFATRKDHHGLDVEFCDKCHTLDKAADYKRQQKLKKPRRRR